MYYETSDKKAEFALIVASCDHFLSINEEKRSPYKDPTGRMHSPREVRSRLIAKWKKTGWSDAKTKSEILHLLAACRQQMGFGQVKEGSGRGSFKFCTMLVSRLLKSQKVVIPPEKKTAPSKATNSQASKVVNQPSTSTANKAGAPCNDNVPEGKLPASSLWASALASSKGTDRPAANELVPMVENVPHAQSLSAHSETPSKHDRQAPIKIASPVSKHHSEPAVMPAVAPPINTPIISPTTPSTNTNSPPVCMDTPLESIRTDSPTSKKEQHSVVAKDEQQTPTEVGSPVSIYLPNHAPTTNTNSPPVYIDTPLKNIHTDPPTSKKEQLDAIMKEMQLHDAQNQQLTAGLLHIKKRIDGFEHGNDAVFRQWMTKREHEMNDELRSWEINLNTLLVDQIQAMRAVMSNHLMQHNGQFDKLVRQSTLIANQTIYNTQTAALGILYKQSHKLKKDCLEEMSTSAQSLMNAISARAQEVVSQQKRAQFDAFIEGGSHYPASSITPLTATSMGSTTASSTALLSATSKQQQLPSPSLPQQDEFNPLQFMESTLAEFNNTTVSSKSPAETTNTRKTTAIRPPSSKPFFPLEPPDANVIRSLVFDEEWQENKRSPFEPMRMTLLVRVTGIVHRTNPNSTLVVAAPAESIEQDASPWRSGADGKDMAVQLIAGTKFCGHFDDANEAAQKLNELIVGTLILADAATNFEHPDCLVHWIEKRSFDLSLLRFQVVKDVW